MGNVSREIEIKKESRGSARNQKHCNRNIMDSTSEIIKEFEEMSTEIYKIKNERRQNE